MVLLEDPPDRLDDLSVPPAVRRRAERLPRPQSDDVFLVYDYETQNEGAPRSGMSGWLARLQRAREHRWVCSLPAEEWHSLAAMAPEERWLRAEMHRVATSYLTPGERHVWERCSWRARVEWLATEWTRLSLAETERRIFDQMDERNKLPFLRPLPSAEKEDERDVREGELGPCWNEVIASLGAEWDLMIKGMLERESTRVGTPPRLANPRADPADASAARERRGSDASAAPVALHLWLNQLQEEDILMSSEVMRVELTEWLKIVIQMASWSITELSFWCELTPQQCLDLVNAGLFFSPVDGRRVSVSDLISREVHLAPSAEVEYPRPASPAFTDMQPLRESSFEGDPYGDRFTASSWRADDEPPAPSPAADPPAASPADSEPPPMPPRAASLGLVHSQPQLRRQPAARQQLPWGTAPAGSKPAPPAASRRRVGAYVVKPPVASGRHAAACPPLSPRLGVVLRPYAPFPRRRLSRSASEPAYPLPHLGGAAPSASEPAALVQLTQREAKAALRGGDALERLGCKLSKAHLSPRRRRPDSSERPRPSHAESAEEGGEAVGAVCVERGGPRHELSRHRIDQQLPALYPPCERSPSEIDEQSFFAAVPQPYVRGQDRPVRPPIRVAPDSKPAKEELELARRLRAERRRELIFMRRKRAQFVLHTWRDRPSSNLNPRAWVELHERARDRLFSTMQRALRANLALRSWLSRMAPPTEPTGFDRSLPNALADSITAEWEIVLRERQYMGTLSAADRETFENLTPRQRRRHLIEKASPRVPRAAPSRERVRAPLAEPTLVHAAGCFRISSSLAPGGAGRVVEGLGASASLPTMGHLPSPNGAGPRAALSLGGGVRRQALEGGALLAAPQSCRYVPLARSCEPMESAMAASAKQAEDAWLKARAAPKASANSQRAAGNTAMPKGPTEYQAQTYKSRIDSAPRREPRGVSVRPSWLDSLGKRAVAIAPKLTYQEVLAMTAQEKDWAENLMSRCSNSASWYVRT
ncbi:hypothetical protein AB1Y20_006360 [Prymnesium parvum]|uniref:Uncharacterized protein n=1 Tax=Prymnesium parvum TaxID=97485 RepID=A0AB34J4V7_PRYPA